MSARMSRLDIRTTEQAKKTIEDAANIIGVTMSSFVLESAIERASEVIKSSRQIQLNRKESERFFDLIENPPEPGENLKRLFAKHGSSEEGNPVE